MSALTVPAVVVEGNEDNGIGNILTSSETSIHQVESVELTNLTPHLRLSQNEQTLPSEYDIYVADVTNSLEEESNDNDKLQRQHKKAAKLRKQARFCGCSLRALLLGLVLVQQVIIIVTLWLMWGIDSAIRVEDFASESVQVGAAISSYDFDILITDVIRLNNQLVLQSLYSGSVNATHNLQLMEARIYVVHENVGQIMTYETEISSSAFNGNFTDDQVGSMDTILTEDGVTCVNSTTFVSSNNVTRTSASITNCSALPTSSTLYIDAKTYLNTSFNRFLVYDKDPEVFTVTSSLFSSGVFQGAGSLNSSVSALSEILLDIVIANSSVVEENFLFALVSESSCSRQGEDASLNGLVIFSTVPIGEPFEETVEYVCSVLSNDLTGEPLIGTHETSDVITGYNEVIIQGVVDYRSLAIFSVARSSLQASQKSSQYLSAGVFVLMMGVALASASFITFHFTKPFRLMYRLLDAVLAGGDQMREFIEMELGDEHNFTFSEFSQWTRLCKKFTENYNVIENLMFKNEKEIAILQSTIVEHKNFLATIQNGGVPKRAMSVFVGTWNVGNAEPPNDLTPWLSGNHDVVAIGVQECVYGVNSDTHFFSLTDTALGDNYVRVSFVNIALESKKNFGQNIAAKIIPDIVKDPKERDDVHVKAGIHLADPTGSGGLRLIVYVRKDHERFLSNVHKSRVGTGIAGAFWNKGGVGLSFTLYDQSFCFVTAHLAAHQDQISARNKNVRSILQNLKFNSSDIPTQDSFDYLFWCGDLNYRIDLTYDDCVKTVEQGDYESLRNVDQLIQEMDMGNVFLGFSEETISFQPTYKFARGKKKYETELFRVPSWCDRVLYRSYPGYEIDCVAYDCCPVILTSDHIPVFGIYELKVRMPHFPLIEHTQIRATHLKVAHISLIRPDNEEWIMSKPEMTISCTDPKVIDPVVLLPVVSDANKRSELLFNSVSINFKILDYKYIGDRHLILCLKEEDKSKGYSVVLPISALFISQDESDNAVKTNSCVLTNGSLKRYVVNYAVTVI